MTRGFSPFAISSAEGTRTIEELVTGVEMDGVESIFITCGETVAPGGVTAVPGGIIIGPPDRIPGGAPAGGAGLGWTDSNSKSKINAEYGPTLYPCFGSEIPGFSP